MTGYVEYLGQVTAVIGTQYGDEGKGKIVDALASEYDIIARAAGGANAGHTIIIDGQKHVFHLLASGVLYDRVQIVIGTGMVVHLDTLLEEIELLKKSGVSVIDRIYISNKAHIVMHYHKEIDAWNENFRSASTKGSKGAIGTTKRGIGPAYADKIDRSGLRMEVLKDQDSWQELLKFRAKRVKTLYDLDVDIAAELASLQRASAVLADRVTDTEAYLQTALEQGKSILIEGAQATMLDIDHGNYPFVTASVTTVAGALQGVGLPPAALNSVIGVVKAYCTRVGNGDFASELNDEICERLRKRGAEYGATTGRPRRCGWLNTQELQSSMALNGVTHLALTKLDVLDEEPTIRVATGVTDGKAVYEDHTGWQTETHGLKEYAKLPDGTKQYVEFIEKTLGAPAAFIGTGPERSQLIERL